MENDNSTHLYFNTRDELLKVPLSQVVYFEAEGNYTSIYFRNGLQSQVLASLHTIEDLISNSFKLQNQDEHLAFIRIGRRYIVNIEYIYHINIPKQKLLLTDFVSAQAYELNVSKEALKNLKNIYSPKQK